jgi:hypothetical protein
MLLGAVPVESDVPYAASRQQQQQQQCYKRSRPSPSRAMADSLRPARSERDTRRRRDEIKRSADGEISDHIVHQPVGGLLSRGA